MTMSLVSRKGAVHDRSVDKSNKLFQNRFYIDGWYGLNLYLKLFIEGQFLSILYILEFIFCSRGLCNCLQTEKHDI